MIKEIYFKKKLLAIVLRSNFKPKKTMFVGSSKNTLQLGYIVKKKKDIIKKHRHKKISRKIIGTPEILIIKKGEAKVRIYFKSKEIDNVKLKKGDIISLIDCEHSFSFQKDTILQEIKQGPYIANEKVIYD